MSKIPRWSRRDLLAGTASTIAGAALARVAQAQTTPAPAATQPRPLPAYVGWKDSSQVIVHTATTIETRRSAFGTSIITPADRLYIRNNLPAPDAAIVANRDAWEVAVEGVRQPRTLSVADLKNMGLETVAAVLQCSGNGRAWFARSAKAEGAQRQNGAMGNVVFRGVP